MLLKSIESRSFSYLFINNKIVANIMTLLLVVIITTSNVLFTNAAVTSWGYVSNNPASPLRTASYYLFEVTQQSGLSVLGTMYIFRQGKNINDTVVTNQRPVLSTAGEIRQVFIVEVPSGSVSEERTTFDQISFSGYTIHSTSLFAVAPLTPSDFVYSSTAHETQFQNTSCILQDGTNTTYLDFGYLKSDVDVPSSMVSTSVGVKNSVIYQQFETGTGTQLGYLVDSLPGDHTFSPLRLVYTVSVASIKKKISDLQSPIIPQTTSRHVITAFTDIVGADTYAETFPAVTGYFAGKEIRFLSLNQSRMGTMVTNPKKGMSFNKMYRIPGQVIPVIEYAPGVDGGYSDLIAIYDVVSFATGTHTDGVTFNSVSMIPGNATIQISGRYLNCPVLHSSNSWTSTNGDDVIPPATVTVYYNGATKSCVNFSYVESGCALRHNYRLTRAGDFSIVEQNDIFKDPRHLSLRSSPFIWKFPYSVQQLYVTGTYTSASQLDSSIAATVSQATYTFGEFYNNPIVSRSVLPAPTSTSSSSGKIGTTTSRYSGLHNWTLRYWAPAETAWSYSNQVCFELTSQFGHSAVAIGFGQAESSSSSSSTSYQQGGLQHSTSSVFIAAHFKSTSSLSGSDSCIRTLVRDSSTSQFTDIDGTSLLNLTHLSFVLDDDSNAVKLQFCRNRYPTSTSLASATVGVLGTSVERIEVASGPIRTSSSSTTISLSDVSKLPNTCTTTLDSSLWASVTRFAVDWTASILPAAVLAPAFTTSTTTTLSPLFTAVATTTTSAPSTLSSTTSGSGYYRLDEDKIFSWKTRPAGSTSPTSVIYFLTFNADFYGWMALGFGAVTFVQSDILFVLRHPSLATSTSSGGNDAGIVIKDRKGVSTALWRNDVQQDWSLVADATAATLVDPAVPLLVNNSMTLAFERSLDTSDRGISTQDIPRTQLLAGIFSRNYGWAGGDDRIEYYDFNNGPTFIANNYVESNLYYKMINATSAGTTWQRDIIDVVPGQAGYSDLWRIITVHVPGDFVGPEITAVSDIPPTWQKTTDIGISYPPANNPSYWRNCPVVHSISGVDSSWSGITIHTLWYRGSLTRCIEFAQQFNARNYTTQNGVRIYAEGTNTTLDILLEESPTVDKTVTYQTDINAIAVNTLFTPFVYLYTAYVPQGALYSTGMYRNFSDFVSKSGLPLSTTGTYTNLPIIMPGSPKISLINTNASDGGSGTPSPAVGGDSTVGEFSTSLTSGFSHRVTVQETSDSKIDLLWTLMPDTSTGRAIKIMILGYGIFGYLSVGFSNGNYEKMQNADIAIAIRNAGSTTPCVTTLYSNVKEGFPSADPTMLIRNPNVGAETAGMYFSFERDYHGQAHEAGRIPEPPSSPIVRVLWASLKAATAITCTTPLNLLQLYHGGSPHGSALINFDTGIFTGYVTPAPLSTSAPATPRSVLLRQFQMTRRTLRYRDWDVPAYCAPSVYNDDSNLMTKTFAPLFPDISSVGQTPQNTPSYANITFTEAFSDSQPPTMFFFFAAYDGNDGNIQQLQEPLVNLFVGASSYTGVFRTIFCTVNTMGMNSTEFSSSSLWTTVQSIEAVRTKLSQTNFSRISFTLPTEDVIDWKSLTPTTLFSNYDYDTFLAKVKAPSSTSTSSPSYVAYDERRWINCPAINSLTNVETADLSKFPKMNIFSAGAPFACMNLGNGFSTDIAQGQQSFNPSLIFSTGTSFSSSSSLLNATENINEAWNITETSLAGGVGSNTPLVVDSLRFPIYRISPVRQVSSGSLTSAETISSRTIPIDEFSTRNGTVDIVNCVPIFEQSVLRPSTPKTRSQDGSIHISYFEGRRVTMATFEPAQRTANEKEINVGFMYMMLRGGTTLGEFPRASDHPSFVSNSMPGTITEATIFQVIGVDVGTRNSTDLGIFTNITQLSSLPQQLSQTFFQCTFVPDGTDVGSSSVSISRETIYVDGNRYFCSNFGLVRWPIPSSSSSGSSSSSSGKLPSVYELVGTSGAVISNNILHEQVPGRNKYFSLVWVKKTQLSSTPSLSNPIRSFATLNTFQHTVSTPYRLLSILILTVDSVSSTASSIRTLEISTAPVTNAPIIHRSEDIFKDPTSLLAAPIEFNIEKGLHPSSLNSNDFPLSNRSTYNESSMLKALPTVYFFRRGPTLESPIIEAQSSIVTNLPGETSYMATTGTGGYADLFRVEIVVIPTNMSVAVMKNKATVQDKISTVGNGIYSVKTTTFAALFVAAKSPNSTVDATKVFASAFLGQKQSCADVSVWGEDSLIPSLLCGFAPSLASTMVESQTAMSSATFVVAPYSNRGWSYYIAARLDVANPFVQEEFSVTRITPSFTSTRLVSASIIGSSATGLLNNETAVIGKKYIFRNGPHLYGSAKISNLLPVIDRGSNPTARAQAYRLIVVNVEGSLWKKENATATDAEVFASLTSISRPADIWALVESQCWVVRPTGIIESGPLVSTTTTIPTDIHGTKIENVYAEGMLVQHFVLSESLEQNLDLMEAQYVVGIFSGSTGLRFLFPVIPQVEVITDRFSLYRVVKVQLEELNKDAATKTSIAAATSVETLASILGVSSTVSNSTIISQTMKSDFICHSVLEQALQDASFSNITRSNTSLWTTIHITQVATRPYVPPVTQKNWLRDQFYVNGAPTTAYRFHTSSSLLPSPIYTFIVVDSQGRRFASAAQAVLVHLPGDALYADAHEKFECTVSAGNAQWSAKSAADVSDAMQSGIITGCSSLGLFSYIVMNATSTIESGDIWNSVSNPIGFYLLDAWHDGSKYRVVFPGGSLSKTTFSNPILTNLSIVADLYNSGSSTVPVSRGSVLSEAIVSTTGEWFRICKVSPSSSSTLTLSAGQIKNYTNLVALIADGTVTMTCTSEAVYIVPIPEVVTNGGTSSLIFDDYIFAPENGMMYVNWAFGRLAGPTPLTVVQPATSEGTIRVDIFTGRTDEPTLGETVFTSGNSIKFGDMCDFSWILTSTPPPSSSSVIPSGGSSSSATSSPSGSPSPSSSESRNSRRWGDFPTYSASETFIDFDLKLKSNVWAAVAFVQSDRQYADVYLSYIGSPTLAAPTVNLYYQKEGYYGSKTFVVHTNPTIRPADASNNGRTPKYYHFRSTPRYYGNTSSHSYVWEATTTRPLYNADLTTVDLSSGPVTVLWAVGTWNTAEQLPGATLQRGVVVVDFVGGNWLQLKRSLPSAWIVIAMLILAIAWLLVGLLSRRLNSGRLLFSRPLIACCCNDPLQNQGTKAATSISSFSWFFTSSTLGNLLSMFWFIVMITVWGAGATLDAEEWRSSQPSVIAIFRVLQFCCYFILLPVPRHNLIFYSFGVATNRGQMWQLAILAVTSIVSVLWVVIAAITEMISSTSDVVCSILLACFVCYWYLIELNSGGGRGGETTSCCSNILPNFMIRRESRNFQKFLCLVGVVICIHLIEPTTVYGMIFSIILVVVDIFLYFRDMKGRTGFVRSCRVFPHESRATVALELMMMSNPRPENSCALGPFDVTRPGSFCMVQLDDYGSALTAMPVVISAIQQENEIPFASTAVHLRCSIFDIASAAVAGIPADRSRTLPEMVLRCANENSLEQRAVTVFGPFGGMDHSATGSYNTLVLIAGGSGIASTMSVLENLASNPDVARTTTFRLIEFVWVLKSAEEIEAWKFELQNVLQTVRMFQVKFSFYLTGNPQDNYNPSPPPTFGAGGSSKKKSQSNKNNKFDDMRQPEFSDNDEFDDIYGEKEPQHKSASSTSKRNHQQQEEDGEEMQPQNNKKKSIPPPSKQHQSNHKNTKASKYAVIAKQAAAFYDEGDDEDNANNISVAGDNFSDDDGVYSTNNNSRSPSRIPQAISASVTRSASQQYATTSGGESLFGDNSEIGGGGGGITSEIEAQWSEVADLFRGKPLWEDLLYQIKIDASMRSEEAVAVFMSAPRELARSVIIASENCSDWKGGTALHLEIEKYDEW